MYEKKEEGRKKTEQRRKKKGEGRKKREERGKERKREREKALLCFALLCFAFVLLLLCFALLCVALLCFALLFVPGEPTLKGSGEPEIRGCLPGNPAQSGQITNGPLIPIANSSKDPYRQSLIGEKI